MMRLYAPIGLSVRTKLMCVPGLECMGQNLLLLKINPIDFVGAIIGIADQQGAILACIRHCLSRSWDR